MQNLLVVAMVKPCGHKYEEPKNKERSGHAPTGWTASLTV